MNLSLQISHCTWLSRLISRVANYICLFKSGCQRGSQTDPVCCDLGFERTFDLWTEVSPRGVSPVIYGPAGWAHSRINWNSYTSRKVNHPKHPAPDISLIQWTDPGEVFIFPRSSLILANSSWGNLQKSRGTETISKGHVPAKNY